MSTIDYTFIKKFLLTKKNIVITTHKTPDGDALGSSLALYHELKHNHNVNVIVPNEYPYYRNSQNPNFHNYGFFCQWVTYCS